MNLKRTLTHTSGAAALVLAVGGLTFISGCSTLHSIGSVFGIGKDKELDATAQSAQLANADATNNQSATAQNPFVDPFTPAGVQEKPVVVKKSPRPAPAPAPDGPTTVIFNPWSNNPNANVFGDLSNTVDGPKALPGQQGGADNLDQISFSFEGADFDPNISRDGSFIVFASTQHTETADIYSKNVNGHTLTQLTNNPANDVMPSISPDGSRIAYASDRSGTWNVYLMNVTGGQAVQITNDAAPQLHPSWSPDGERLVYCRLGDTTGRWELWVIEVSNPAVRHFIGYGLLPDWSPVENKIAFQRSRQRGDHFFSVWTIDFIDGEGMNPTEIVSSATAATVNPSFSPDGRRLAFAVVPNPEQAAAGRPQIADLWICNLDGTGKANLTGGVSSNLMPTWGKDNRIFFISDRSGTDNIWALRPDRAILAANGPNPNNPDLASSHQSVNKSSELATVPDDNDN